MRGNPGEIQILQGSQALQGVVVGEAQPLLPDATCSTDDSGSDTRWAFRRQSYF